MTETQIDDENPYQPPTSPLTGRPPIDPTLAKQLFILPGSDFWMVASLSIGLTVLATALTGGLALPFVLSACGGAIRVCLIYQRRARVGLSALPAGRLLLTSSLLTLCLLVCCSISFCCVCVTGVLVLVDNSAAGLAWGVGCVVAAIAAFIYMFHKSVLWAVR